MATKTKPKTKSAGHIKLCEGYDVHPDNIPEIHSFEDACKDRGVDPTKLPIVDGIEDRHQKRIIADYKLSIIAEALRGGKTADYTNRNEYKYFPYFIVEADKKRKSGFGLSYCGCVYWYSAAAVGVRLCFANSDLAEFFGKHFIELHKDHQLYT